MDNWFYNLGRSVNSAMRKGNWLLEAMTGTEADVRKAEYDVGLDLARSFLETTEVEPNADVGRFVNECGALLVPRVKDKGRSFSFRVVRSDETNAFALPGGFVFVTTPLLELCGWDAHEVGFILGHEMGHVLKGHAMERVMRSFLMSAAGRVMPIRGLVGAVLFQQVSGLIQQAYSRDQELDADLLGVKLAHSAGFDPHASTRLLARLMPGSETSPLGVYFASHPPMEVRIAHLNRYLLGQLQK